MTEFKTWLMQLKYPYTAGIIAVMWLGTAVFCAFAPMLSLDVVLVLLSLATLIVAVIGFSSRR